MCMYITFLEQPVVKSITKIIRSKMEIRKKNMKNKF